MGKYNIVSMFEKTIFTAEAVQHIMLSNDNDIDNTVKFLYCESYSDACIMLSNNKDMDNTVTFLYCDSFSNASTSPEMSKQQVNIWLSTINYKNKIDEIIYNIFNFLVDIKEDSDFVNETVKVVKKHIPLNKLFYHLIVFHFFPQTLELIKSSNNGKFLDYAADLLLNLAIPSLNNYINGYIDGELEDYVDFIDDLNKDLQYVEQHLVALKNKKIEDNSLKNLIKDIEKSYNKLSKRVNKVSKMSTNK